MNGSVRLLTLSVYGGEHGIIWADMGRSTLTRQPAVLNNAESHGEPFASENMHPVATNSAPPCHPKIPCAVIVALKLNDPSPEDTTTVVGSKQRPF